MATLISTCIADARQPLLELTARFWSDAELLRLANLAIKDLWKKVIDLYQDHIVTIDTTTMSLVAEQGTIQGVPADLFRVVMIQPRIVGPASSNLGLIFKPRTLTHPDFVQAQALRSRSARQCIIFYAVINAGAPVGAPTIKIAPKVSANVPLEVWYNPVIPDKAAADPNPIPGESDKAITAYIVAFGRAKEREDNAPDPEWLSIYATEARNLLIALTPRSVQEPEMVVGMWEGQGTDGPGDWDG
jgi:hypothetical protein